MNNWLRGGQWWKGASRARAHKEWKGNRKAISRADAHKWPKSSKKGPNRRLGPEQAREG